MSSCTTPTEADFHCDEPADGEQLNVDDRLERMNTTRFTATAYNDQQQQQRQQRQQQPTNLRKHHVVSDPSSTVTSDVLLMDFGFIWIVFLTLDALLVTRRIGNICLRWKCIVFAECTWIE